MFSGLYINIVIVVLSKIQRILHNQARFEGQKKASMYWKPYKYW